MDPGRCVPWHPTIADAAEVMSLAVESQNGALHSRAAAVINTGAWRAGILAKHSGENCSRDHPVELSARGTLLSIPEVVFV